MSNPDWPGPYWQQPQQDDAGSGWRNRHSDLPQEQSPWDDASFWRSDDRRGARSDDRQAGRASRHAAGADSGWDDGRGSRPRAGDRQRPAEGGRGDGGSRGSDRPRGSGGRGDGGWSGDGRSANGGSRGGDRRRDDGSWAQDPRGEAPRGGERPRRVQRSEFESGREGQGGGRFSQTADDLKSRLGMRGSVLSRDRSGPSEQQVDDDFWGEPDRRRTRRDSGADSGHRARGAGQNGASQNGAGSNGAGQNGAGQNGAGQNGAGYGAASNGNGRGAGSNGNGRGAAPNGNGHGGWDGGRTEAWQEDGAGRGGYRGSRRANGSNGSDGFDRDGTGQWASARTAVKERATRLSEGVRNKTATLQRGRRGGGGWDGGDGWDGGRGGPHDDGPLTRSERFKRWLRSGDWWRHWTWKKALAVAGGACAACILLAIIGVIVVYEMTPIPTAAELTANWQSSTVYFSNGKQLGTFDDDVNGVNVDRQLLTPSQIPNDMDQAMVAAEDRGFYTEGGISVTGLMRSAYEDVFGSGGLQGGSTITMQYAKNYYTGVDTGQNASTKIKEIFIAMKLAHTRAKWWILTQYLNTVPFGPTIYGVGAAAESYFDVNLTQGGTLTVSQAAMLAAMPNEPGVFNPQPGTPGYAPLVARWHYVLTNMVRDGAITQATASKQVFPAYTPPTGGNGWTGDTAYLMQMVEQQLLAPKADGGFGLTEQQIDTKGYRITTTFSPYQMAQLARSVNQEKQQLADDANASTVASLPDYDHIGSVLENAKTGAIVAIYGGPGYLANEAQCAKVDCQINTAEVPEEVGSSFKPYVLATAVNEGMSVFTSRLDGYAPIYIPEEPADANSTEMALSVNKPPAGASNVSQYGFWLGQMFYYYFGETAENSGRPLPVNVAAAISSDPAFEDLAHRDGIQNIINMAGQLGVGKSPFLYPSDCTVPSSTYAQTLAACNDLTGQNGLQAQFSPTQFSKAARANGTPGSPAIALGEGPLTAVEQATTFATFADQGVYHAAHVIQSMSQNGTPIPVMVPTYRVLSTGAADDVDWALSFDNNMNGGTAEGTVTFHPGGIIAKTGTLGSGADSSQAWFVGATPDQYAMSVALYTNDPGSQILDNLPYTPSGEQGSLGGGWPASIWNNLFTTEWGNTPDVPVNQVFPSATGNPFIPWIQAKPQQKKLPNCKPGQTKNCKPVACKPQRFGQPCGGNPNPNPSQSCGFTFQCGNPTPTASPSPSCGGFGQPPCSSSSPSPTTSPSPTPCASAFPGGPCATEGATAAVSGQGAADTSAERTDAVVAEEKSAVLVASLGKVAVT